MTHALMLAQAVVDIPKNAIVETIWGLVGVMVILITILSLVIMIQKVFGRKPPLEKEFSTLRKELYEVNGRTKKALEKEINGQATRIDGVETDLEDIKLDRQRKWEHLTDEMHAIDSKVSHLTGRVEAVLRKMETYEPRK